MQFTFGAVGVRRGVPGAELFRRTAGLQRPRNRHGHAIPYGLVQFVMSFMTPPLMKRTSARAVIILGFALVAAGCFMNIHLDSNAATNVIVPSLIVRGIGQSLVVVALSVMAVQGMEKSQLGSASGLFSTVRNVGGAIGIAVASQIVVEREKLHAMPDRRGDHVIQPGNAGAYHRSRSPLRRPVRRAVHRAARGDDGAAATAVHLRFWIVSFTAKRGCWPTAIRS